MKRSLKYIFAAVFIMYSSYELTILCIPNVIYAVAKKNILARGPVSENIPIPSPPMDASARAVVMPNPDFRYVIAYYNLSEGPLRLKGKTYVTSFLRMRGRENFPTPHYGIILVLGDNATISTG